MGQTKTVTPEGISPSDAIDTAKGKHSLTAGQIHTKPHVKSLTISVSFTPYIMSSFRRQQQNTRRNLRHKPRSEVTKQASEPDSNVTELRIIRIGI